MMREPESIVGLGQRLAQVWPTGISHQRRSQREGGEA
jgi:hypothetical protein